MDLFAACRAGLVRLGTAERGATEIRPGKRFSFTCPLPLSRPSCTAMSIANVPLPSHLVWSSALQPALLALRFDAGRLRRYWHEWLLVCLRVRYEILYDCFCYV